MSLKDGVAYATLVTESYMTGAGANKRSACSIIPVHKGLRLYVHPAGGMMGQDL